MPVFSTGFKKSLAALNASRTALKSPIVQGVELVSAYHLEHDRQGVTPPISEIKSFALKKAGWSWHHRI